ncbi:MAG: hypothetical protein Udaeo_07060 [Candidatus Udaeobacter sp.]|nr:MAG: hypothetical protein Udaeo_07060 [Candidatus Udaeobacter sp.]
MRGGCVSRRGVAASLCEAPRVAHRATATVAKLYRRLRSRSAFHRAPKRSIKPEKPSSQLCRLGNSPGDENGIKNPLSHDGHGQSLPSCCRFSPYFPPASSKTRCRRNNTNERPFFVMLPRLKFRRSWLPTSFAAGRSGLIFRPTVLYLWASRQTQIAASTE